MCYAFRTGHSSNNVLTRSTWQSPWVSQESVGVGVALTCGWVVLVSQSLCILRVLFVRAQATVPKCHLALSHLNPHVWPIHSSLSQVPDFLFEFALVFRCVSDGLSMMTLKAIELASDWCPEVNFGWLRRVSKDFYQTFEFTPGEVILRHIEIQYADHFAQFLERPVMVVLNFFEPEWHGVSMWFGFEWTPHATRR